MSNEVPVINRNGVDKTLTKQVFGKLSNRDGEVFYAPVVDVSNPEDVKWAGPDTVNGFTNKGLRKVFADLYIEYFNAETKEFNLEAWKADAADFTAGQAKLSDLSEEIDDLQAIQQTYFDDPELSLSEAGQPLTERAAELLTLMKTNSNKIKGLRAQREAIEEKYKARAAKRKANAPEVAVA